MKCLGKGAVGSVYLVRSRVTGYMLALKMLQKSAISGLNEVTNIINEKKIMKSIPLNNYTANFYASFESA